MKMFLVDEEDAATISLVKKLAKGKNGKIIFVSKKELAAYDRIRIITVEEDKK